MRLGVFDSGVGGLTVLRAIRHQYPWLDCIYLGDTARVPYGTKSARSVERYADQAIRFLVERYGAQAIVIACNTASAVAGQQPTSQSANLVEKWQDRVPLMGVVEPSAKFALQNLDKASKQPLVGVLATEGTIQGGAYDRALAQLAPQVRVAGKPAQLFVALAEEGWVDDDVALATAKRYVSQLIAEAGQVPDVLILGCTHFPLLKGVVRQALDALGAASCRLLDSSEAIAQELRTLPGVANAGAGTKAGSLTLLSTDERTRFARIGSTFLAQPLEPSDVQVVDLK